MMFLFNLALLSLVSLSGLVSCASTKSDLTAASVAPNRNVLIVLSGKDYVTTKEGRRHPTGYFLSELAEPSLDLLKAGYSLSFATPGGVKPTMDQVSNDQRWFKSEEQFSAAKRFVASNAKLSRPLVLEHLTAKDLDAFAGILVPGGHAPLEDLATSPAMGRVLEYFHERHKPTALVCHGPAALLSARSGSRWAYAGYQMTTFSGAEERQEESAGHLDGHMKIYLDDALTAKGGVVSVGSPWSSHAIRDRELVTGQNPMSAKEFTSLFLEVLSEQQIRITGLKPFLSSGTLPLGQFVYVDHSTKNAAEWDSGYKTVWIGSAKGSIKEFDARISSHVRLTSKTFASQGLKEYLVFAGHGYEVAYMLWSSKEAASKAFATQGGKAVVSDAGSFMDQVLFKEVDHNPLLIDRR